MLYPIGPSPLMTMLQRMHGRPKSQPGPGFGQDGGYGALAAGEQMTGLRKLINDDIQRTFGTFNMMA